MKLVLTILLTHCVFGHDWLIVPGERVGPVVAGISEEELRQALGPNVVKRQQIPFGEEEFEDGTVLYGEDPSRALAIKWRDAGKRSRPEAVIVCYGLMKGPCQWHLENGIGFGTPLSELEQSNGRPFTLTGFSYEEAGLIASWMGGKLNSLMQAGRRVLISVEPESDSVGDFRPSPSVDELKALMRGMDFSSADPLMRKMNPRIAEIMVELR